MPDPRRHEQDEEMANEESFEDLDRNDAETQRPAQHAGETAGSRAKGSERSASKRTTSGKGPRSSSRGQKRPERTGHRGSH